MCSHQAPAEKVSSAMSRLETTAIKTSALLLIIAEELSDQLIEDAAEGLVGRGVSEIIIESLGVMLLSRGVAVDLREDINAAMKEWEALEASLTPPADTADHPARPRALIDMEISIDKVIVLLNLITRKRIKALRDTAPHKELGMSVLHIDATDELSRDYRAAVSEWRALETERAKTLKLEAAPARKRGKQ
jgi:hypothetical protein